MLDKYNEGIEPLDSWETSDLSDLESVVNSELQDRFYRSSAAAAVFPEFDNYED